MTQPKLITALPDTSQELQNSFRSISVQAERKATTGELYKLPFVWNLCGTGGVKECLVFLSTWCYVHDLIL
jgi:hypothetical protein